MTLTHFSIPAFVFAIISFACVAQTAIRISGEVVDGSNNAPLAFASISLKGSPVGTVTNSDGRFDFYIPSEHRSDTVVVSFLGYSSYLAVASSLLSSSDLRIKLTPKALLLEEVVVGGTTPNALEILEKAFRSVESNYPTEPYVYTGFIRESWVDNGKTVSLTESAVDVYDDGYRTRKNKSVKVREKVSLKFSRASYNYMNDAFRRYQEKYNALTAALRWNQVKYPNPDFTNFKSKDVILENVVVSNESKLYVVSFITNIASNDWFQRKDTYFIDSETFAVKKIEWREYSKNGKYRVKPWSLDSVRTYNAKDVVTVYEFEEFDGKMYLKYFREHGEADICNSKTKSVEYQLEGDAMFVVTEIQSRRNVPPLNDSMDHDKSLSLQVRPYDAAFWNNYDQVKLVPLTDKQVKDLEMTEGLNEQFIRSGQRNLKRLNK